MPRLLLIFAAALALAGCRDPRVPLLIAKLPNGCEVHEVRADRGALLPMGTYAITTCPEGVEPLTPIVEEKAP